METDAFEKLVEEVIDTLPEEFQEKLNNVAIVVEDIPSWEQMAKVRIPHGSTLFGLYEGVPNTRRGAGYALVPPDKITIFQRPIEFFYRTPDAIRTKVRDTVLHEIGHHFGMSEEELRRKRN